MQDTRRKTAGERRNVVAGKHNQQMTGTDQRRKTASEKSKKQDSSFKTKTKKTFRKIFSENIGKFFKETGIEKTGKARKRKQAGTNYCFGTTDEESSKETEKEKDYKSVSTENVSGNVLSDSYCGWNLCRPFSCTDGYYIE